MDRETTWAASITKGVFGTYVMSPVERGEFSLDVPIAKQLLKTIMGNSVTPWEWEGYKRGDE
jgi:CubicO group peptidase (beta-lactamase class C family)